MQQHLARGVELGHAVDVFEFRQRGELKGPADVLHREGGGHEVAAEADEDVAVDGRRGVDVERGELAEVGVDRLAVAVFDRAQREVAADRRHVEIGEGGWPEVVLVDHAREGDVANDVSEVRKGRKGGVVEVAVETDVQTAGTEIGGAEVAEVGEAVVFEGLQIAKGVDGKVDDEAAEAREAVDAFEAVGIFVAVDDQAPGDVGAHRCAGIRQAKVIEVRKRDDQVTADRDDLFEAVGTVVRIELHTGVFALAVDVDELTRDVDFVGVHRLTVVAEELPEREIAADRRQQLGAGEGVGFAAEDHQIAAEGRELLQAVERLEAAVEGDDEVAGDRREHLET